MPTLLHLSEKPYELAYILGVKTEQITVKGAVFIECELIPAMQRGQNEADIAAAVDAANCQRCGYKKDAKARGFQICCGGAQSPHMAIVKQKIAEIRKIVP